MKNKKTIEWKKVYKGPFEKKEAIGIMEDLQKVADIEKNGIVKVAIRKRRKTTNCVCTASCGAGLGHNSYKYDIFVKTEI